MSYEIWRSSFYGGWVLEHTTRWRWWARLWAWEHTTRGWFRYEVREAGPEEEE